MRHAQIDLWRFSVWAGIDTSIWAVSVFLGYKQEEDWLKLGVSFGPLYVGGGLVT